MVMRSWVDSAFNRNECQESGLGGREALPVHKAYNLTTIYESIVYKMSTL
jgi:hypothetical protein